MILYIRTVNANHEHTYYTKKNVKVVGVPVHHGNHERAKHTMVVCMQDEQLVGRTFRHHGSKEGASRESHKMPPITSSWVASSK